MDALTTACVHVVRICVSKQWDLLYNCLQDWRLWVGPRTLVLLLHCLMSTDAEEGRQVLLVQDVHLITPQALTGTQKPIHKLEWTSMGTDICSHALTWSRSLRRLQTHLRCRDKHSFCDFCSTCWERQSALLKRSCDLTCGWQRHFCSCTAGFR